ncbi:hypothetical protein [Teredinibacter turnerae]|uniref:hypothetical protein n=1 Tax=Teredinibacter turnerae TaxID=2426 RepID=UPI000375D5E2|nr:hypothetical protein [Teredinibacter turnerae]
MELPEGFVGPVFSGGDFVTFRFDDADLSFRVLALPTEVGRANRVSVKTDFTAFDRNEWRERGEIGHLSKSLVAQSWQVYHEETHLNIADMFFSVEVVRNIESEVKSLFSLDFNQFYSVTLSEISELYSEDVSSDISYYPTLENNFLFQKIDGYKIGGIRAELMVIKGQKQPSTCAFFSLGRTYTLEIELSLYPWKYEDIAQQYTDEFLLKFKEQLFDDFLANLTIEYSAEAKAIIEQLEKP